MITEEKLREILPQCNNVRLWAAILEDVLPQYGIETGNQKAMFIAQTGHESAQFNVLKENLNYSAKALRSIFSKYFPNDAFAEGYARQPEKIANRVYAGRMGNGNEASGDGWLYRGRGIVQITGKNNYRMCSMYLFKDERLVQDPSLLLEPEFAVRSACWFWLANRLLDHDDVKTVTRIINGGYNGLEDREMLFDRSIKVLSA